MSNTKDFNEARRALQSFQRVFKFAEHLDDVLKQAQEAESDLAALDRRRAEVKQEIDNQLAEVVRLREEKAAMERKTAALKPYVDAEVEKANAAVSEARAKADAEIAEIETRVDQARARAEEYVKSLPRFDPAA